MKGAIQCYGNGPVIKDHAECNAYQDGIVGGKFGGNQNSDSWGYYLLNYMMECLNT